MKKNYSTLLNSFIILPFIALFCYPLIWLVTACFKSTGDIFKPMQLFPSNPAKRGEVLMPADWDFKYFSQLFKEEDIQFWDYWGNSLLMTTSQALLAVVISASVAYYFVYRDSKWNRILFVFAVALILIPRQIMIYPLRELVFKTGMNDNLLSVILTGAVSGIGIIFFIQIYRNLPRDYVDMARMEGASEFRVFTNTIPLLFSAFLCCFMIHFIIAWQMHLIPLQLLNENQVLPVGIASLFTSSMNTDLAVIMCAGIFCIIPSAVIFALTYKKFRSAMSESMQ